MIQYGTDYPDPPEQDEDGVYYLDDLDDLEGLGAVIEWPTLPEAALQGVAGQIVRKVSPYTEADPAAILFCSLAAFGALVGTRVYFLIANQKHCPRLWVLVIGDTNAGAKGTSWSVVRAIFAPVDSSLRFISQGIASGEGLIEAVHDNPDPSKTPDDPAFDEGIVDKRLLICQAEFAGLLRRGRRDGSTITEVMREAWDAGPEDVLGTVARSRNSLRATGPHVVMVGHCTPGELSRTAKDDTDFAGGTMNRFLLALSKRSRLLPDGGNIPADVLAELHTVINAALTRSQGVTEMTRTENADALWREHYGRLQRSRGGGRFARSVSRAAVQVIRMSMVYALLDSHTRVHRRHLRAALALWDYAEHSARWLWSNAAADESRKDRDELLAFITAAADAGVTRTQIANDHFKKHKSSDEIKALLAALIHDGSIKETQESGRGRPLLRYRATGNGPPTAATRSRT